MAKETPLCAEHLSLGARMVDFAGWMMPVQYVGIREEHTTVRTQVGLFDVSHMGEIWVRGPRAVETLQWTTTNDLSQLKAGQAHYSFFPSGKGGIVDDLIVYCTKPGEEYLLCVNASNTDKDFEFLKTHNKGADIKNESADWAQIAVQGPKAERLLDMIFEGRVSKMGSFTHSFMKYGTGQVIVARTGYTGEKGAEIFVRPSQAAQLWRELLDLGRTLGVAPIGLGARDTLRTEMKYTLYGHEIDDTTNPYAAGLGWVVKPKEKDFLGREAMVAAKELGLKHQLVGFKLRDRGIPRQGMKLFDKTDRTREIGWVTSGTLSPTLNESIGIAYIEKGTAAVGSVFSLDVRGRHVPAEVVKTPFVKPGS